MKKSHFILLIILLLFLGNIDLHAQCAVCKAVVESNMQTAQKMAKGINDGILYLMAIPYVLVGVVGFLLYKNYKKFTPPAKAEKSE